MCGCCKFIRHQHYGMKLKRFMGGEQVRGSGFEAMDTQDGQCNQNIVLLTRGRHSDNITPHCCLKQDSHKTKGIVVLQLIPMFLKLKYELPSLQSPETKKMCRN